MTNWDAVSDAEWVARAAHSLGYSWQLMAEAGRGRTEQWDELMVADSASPNPFMNAVTLTQPLTDSNAESVTHRLAEYFGQRPDGGSWLLWSGWPTPDLAPLGYVLWGHPPVMVRLPGGAAPPLPHGLRIAEAQTTSDLADIELGMVQAMPMAGLEPLLPGAMFPPALLGGPFRFWGGYLDDELVTVAAAVVGEHEIDVSFIATLPHARGKGYGAAITWAATMADPSLPAILEASDHGRPVYEKMGYRHVGKMALWERPRDMSNPVYSSHGSPQT